MNNTSFGKGVFFAALAFTLWGVLPLYWKLLASIDPLHILAFRIIFSLLLVGTILILLRNSAWLAVFKNAKLGLLQILTALILCVNWGLYIWAVNQGHTIDASLGYYINPLVSIALGLLFFREKLKALQWAAFGLACLGVLILTVLSGRLPWISLALALTFGTYGLLKKKIPLSALESLGAETLAALPFGLFLLLFRFGGEGEPRLLSGLRNLSYLGELPAHIWALLALCGAVSALPLYFFARGAKTLPLSTLGFTQILSPTIQFLLGFFVFGEYFPRRYFIAFAFIWFAVVLYVISLKNTSRAKAAE